VTRCALAVSVLAALAGLAGFQLGGDRSLRSAPEPAGPVSVVWLRYTCAGDFWGIRAIPPAARPAAALAGACRGVLELRRVATVPAALAQIEAEGPQSLARIIGEDGEDVPVVWETRPKVQDGGAK
jgi:hypothetical protein